MCVVPQLWQMPTLITCCSLGRAGPAYPSRCEIDHTAKSVVPHPYRGLSIYILIPTVGDGRNGRQSDQGRSRVTVLQIQVSSN